MPVDEAPHGKRQRRDGQKANAHLVSAQLQNAVLRLLGDVAGEMCKAPDASSWFRRVQVTIDGPGGGERTLAVLLSLNDVYPTRAQVAEEPVDKKAEVKAALRVAARTMLAAEMAEIERQNKR